MGERLKEPTPPRVLPDPGQGVRAAATWAVSSELRT
jgi:hypothetical protein